MKSLSGSFISVSLILLLTACGGGGGGSGVFEGGGNGNCVSSTTLSCIRHDAASEGKEQQAAQKAATALPRFGSVTQSSNQNQNSGISTDAVDTDFSGASDTGGQLTTTITRQGKETIVLDGEVSATGRPSDRRIVGGSPVWEYDHSSATLGFVRMYWASSNPSTDYLALGYWIHVTGSNIQAGQISGVEIGAFADGPEIDGAMMQGVTGTATYTGEAAGLYTTRSPSLQDPDLGEFSGDIRLTADFGTQSISGSVDNLKLAEVDEDGSGETSSYPYVINLGSTPFNSEGEFRGETVGVTFEGTPTTSGGSWGGQFSGTSDSAEKPRLVAGTLGGTTEGADGRQVSFVGTFYGATDNFQ